MYLKRFIPLNQSRFIADDRHIIIIAGSHAGKGVSVIIPNLIFYPGSVLAIDPKGELASITGRRRGEGLRQRVFVFDPFGRTSEAIRPYRASFNPMGILTEDNRRHIVEDAGLIADALVIPGGGDIHRDEIAKNLIEGLILHVATWPAYEGRRHGVQYRTEDDSVRIARRTSRHRSSPPTMNELAEYLVMDRSTLGHNLRPLLRKDLVALKPDPIDGRTRRVTLTAKGASKYANAKASWRKAQQEYEVLIGKTAAVALGNALQK